MIMKYTSITILLLALQAWNNKEESTSLSNPVMYKLIWSDEFNADGPPDSLKWQFESGFVRNEEAQWYQKENAVCDKGFLVITGRKENRLNPNYVAGSNNWKTNRKNIEYTSSSLVMKREHAFQYGRIEVRAKIDAQEGLWPAIWTLGKSGEWPSNGEVDIMEYYDDKILANFAHADNQRYKAIWDGASVKLKSLGGKKWANEFHVWTLLWDEEQMQIFVDDLFLNSIDLNTTINKTDRKNPFKQPHYLLLNLAMGGNRGGSLGKTDLPSKYFVDYVRVFQKE